MFAQRLTYLHAAAAVLKDITVQLWNPSFKKSFPVYSERECLRRIRQIATGQLTCSNGLAWPGQVISKSDGKLYLHRPFIQ
jgi:hypothetical protein